jgi:5'-nucleotidase (lipoprotein e(P4) family)
MRATLLASLLAVPFLPACAADDGSGDLGGPADVGDGGKMDGGPSIDVLARIEPGTTDVTLTNADPRHGYAFYAAEDTQLYLTTTVDGSDPGSSTKLVLYGPRLQDGTYAKTLATNDSGLSKIHGVKAPYSGFYLVEVTYGTKAAAVDGQKARLQLTCTGTCTSTNPIVPIDEGLKWYRRSAERRADTFQAYKWATAKLSEKVTSGAPSNWAVVLDVDETTLNNSAYQQRRLDLGVGYSPGTWDGWVSEKAATAIDGVVDFTASAHALGGKVVLVTNRTDGQCAPTEANLQAVGVTYDAILCMAATNPTTDKNPRFQAIEAGSTGNANLPSALTTIMYVGDSIGDFPQLTEDIRKSDASAFDRFGDDFIHIPNPMYGAFDKNTDANP